MTNTLLMMTDGMFVERTLGDVVVSSTARGYSDYRLLSCLPASPVKSDWQLHAEGSTLSCRAGLGSV